MMILLFLMPGKSDQSGMRLMVTERLRQYDAGIMELGLIYSDKMAIPPNTFGFQYSGYCVPSCTKEVSIGSFSGVIGFLSLFEFERDFQMKASPSLEVNSIRMDPGFELLLNIIAMESSCQRSIGITTTPLTSKKSEPCISQEESCQ